MKRISIDHKMLRDLTRQFKISPVEVLEILQFEDSYETFSGTVRCRAMELGGRMKETYDRHVYLTPAQLFELSNYFSEDDFLYLNQALTFDPAIPEGEDIRAYAIEELGGKIIEKVI